MNQFQAWLDTKHRIEAEKLDATTLLELKRWAAGRGVSFGAAWEDIVHMDVYNPLEFLGWIRDTEKVEGYPTILRKGKTVTLETNYPDRAQDLITTKAFYLVAPEEDIL